MFKKLSILLVTGILLWGCASKKQVVKSPDPVQPVTQEGTNEEPSVRFDDWSTVAEVETIYFDYDKSTLRKDARDSLKRNAEYLKNNPSLNILVEGHCDERGTIEYNLGLGQRRAKAVREYYGRLGISLGRIGTISYGEEKPAVMGSGDSIWAQNRRAETKVRSK